MKQNKSAYAPSSSDMGNQVPYASQQFGGAGGVSKFDGGLLGQIGIGLLGALLILVTLGLGTCWATCMMYRWYARHTRIDGRQVIFDGKGIQLLGCSLKWAFFTIITLGIYSLWLPLKQTAWVVSHTHLA